MSGSLTIVGLGPGAPELTTPAVSQALRDATDLVGYEAYLAIRFVTGPTIGWKSSGRAMRFA